MKILIMGGAGFIGVRSANALLDRGVLSEITAEEEPIDEFLLFDTFDARGLF